MEKKIISHSIVGESASARSASGITSKAISQNSSRAMSDNICDCDRVAKYGSG